MGVTAFDPRPLIARKRAGETLEAEELRTLIDAYVAGDVDDAQVAAFLMAGVIRGFDEQEAVALTEALVASGDTVDLSALRGPTVDKHSTGGVGDTTTLVVAPVVAACGLQVAKLSGRGLGHTGGTLDKLEAIPGFQVDLAADRFREQVERIGLAVAAATSELVPGDKLLYALRDRTATVDDRALIASSVMSKKIAGGADCIVLDVKTGDGAFMRDTEDAVGLADLCVRIGRAHGRRTAALVTDMDQPLGSAVGNALEVAEAVAVLRGEMPAARLTAVCVELATTLVEIATGEEHQVATDRVERALSSGDALDRFREFVGSQGGDVAVAERPWDVLPTAPVVRTWSPGDGTVAAIACRGTGDLANALGAGRTKAGAAVDPAVGLEVLASVGDEVSADDAVVRIHARTEDDADAAAERLRTLVLLGEPPPRRDLVHARLGT